MIRALILAVALAFAAAPALAAEVYAGTVGGREVVLMIRHDGAQLSGRYAFRQTGRGQSLQGEATGPTLLLHDETGASVGLWRLRLQDGNLTGSWRATARSTAEPAVLHLVATTTPAAEPPPNWVDQNVSVWGGAAGWPNEERRYWQELARAPVNLGPEQALGSGALRMATDPRTSVAWPRLTGFPDPVAMARLNAVFEENRSIAVADVLDCHASREMPQPAEPDPSAPTARITYLGPRLISLTIEGSMDCGGAPEAFHRSITYDIRTAAPFTVASLLRLETPEQQAAFQRFWVARFRAALAGGPSRGDCYEFRDDEVPPVTLRVSATGIAIERSAEMSLDVPCAVELVDIPLADLAPYLRDGAEDYWR